MPHKAFTVQGFLSNFYGTWNVYSLFCYKSFVSKWFVDCKHRLLATRNAWVVQKLLQDFQPSIMPGMAAGVPVLKKKTSTQNFINTLHGMLWGREFRTLSWSGPKRQFGPEKALLFLQSRNVLNLQNWRCQKGGLALKRLAMRKSRCKIGKWPFYSRKI